MDNLLQLLTVLVLSVILRPIVSGDEFGSRLFIEKSLSKAIANSDIDGRIAAILNSGHIGGDYYSTPDRVTKSDRKGSQMTTINAIPVDLPQEYGDETPLIEVNGSETPVDIVFRTKSPKVKVEQRHEPGVPTEVKATRHEEEPHYVRHEVFRPVIQELTEVIQPYRRFVQEIQPVIEEIHQIVSSSQSTRPNTYATSASNRAQTTESIAPKTRSPFYPPIDLKKFAPMRPQRYYSSPPTAPHKIGSSMRSQGLTTSYRQTVERPSFGYNREQVSGNRPQTFDYRRGLTSNARGLTLGDVLSAVDTGRNVNVPQYSDTNAIPVRNNADDGYYIDYKFPIDFELADSKALPITSMNSNSKVYELRLTEEESKSYDTRNQYSLPSKSSSDDIKISAKNDIKSKLKSSVKSK